MTSIRSIYLSRRTQGLKIITRSPPHRQNTQGRLPYNQNVLYRLRKGLNVIISFLTCGFRRLKGATQPIKAGWHRVSKRLTLVFHRNDLLLLVCFQKCRRIEMYMPEHWKPFHIPTPAQKKVREFIFWATKSQFERIRLRNTCWNFWRLLRNFIFKLLYLLNFKVNMRNVWRKLLEGTEARLWKTERNLEQNLKIINKKLDTNLRQTEKIRVRRKIRGKFRRNIREAWLECEGDLWKHKENLRGFSKKYER